MKNKTTTAQADKLARHGKSLRSLMNVYGRILSGEIVCDEAGVDSIKRALMFNLKEIQETISA